MGVATAFARVRARGLSSGAQIGFAVVLSTTLLSQSLPRTAPRMAPVPESQRSPEQQALAARFASSGIPNAVATYLNHPSLAEHILPYEQYVATESALPARHRALLILRTAWLARSTYV